MGPRGLTVLSIAGIAGAFFGVLGWTQRGTGLVASPVSASPVIIPTASPTPATTGLGASSAAASASASAVAGPELSSMPYAPYAYQVWPGPVSADGKTALSGWTITITRQSGGITVKAALDGQPMKSVSHFYAGGAKVYILDSNLSENGGDVTDKGLEVTNAQGQVLA